MTQKFANAARAELASAINDSDASLTITEGGALFPVADTGAAAIGPGADWFKLVLQDAGGIEVVYCRTHASASNTFSNLLRGQDGTTARGFAATAVVGVRPLASDHDRFEAAAVAAGSHAASTNNPHSVTKAQVGLSSVDNTSDASKPVSTATQTALNAKAPLASPAFTGTPTGITKAHVGLGNVDNTSDASKPVSTATQTALNAKAPLASPAFTGTVSGITKAMVGLGSVDNVSAASLRDRTTHTGVQGISTVSGLQDALDQINTKLKQRFAAGADFTPGTSTTVTLTETPIAPTKDALQIFFDSGYQQESEWSYNSTTGVVTFTSAIPSGVSGVEATWGAALSAGVASSVVGQTGMGTALITAPDAQSVRTASGAASEADLQALDGELDFATVSINGGNPIAISSRYVEPHPFPGHDVLAEVQLYISGKWVSTWMTASNSTYYGTEGGAEGDNVAVETASGGVAYYATGLKTVTGWTGADGIIANVICRVKVWKLKGATA